MLKGANEKQVPKEMHVLKNTEKNYQTRIHLAIKKGPELPIYGGTLKARK